MKKAIAKLATGIVTVATFNVVAVSAVLADSTCRGTQYGITCIKPEATAISETEMVVLAAGIMVLAVIFLVTSKSLQKFTK